VWCGCEGARVVRVWWQISRERNGGEVATQAF